MKEARLVATTCDQAWADDAKARVAEMRAAVDASFKEWHDAQPECWAADREHYLGRKRMEQERSLGRMLHPRPTSAAPMQADAKVPAAKTASGTNNQVAGVDEADLVKTALRIVEAPSARVVSVTRLAGTVREMFVEGDRAVVYAAIGGTGSPRCTYGYDCAFGGDGSTTKSPSSTSRAAPSRSCARDRAVRVAPRRPPHRQRGAHRRRRGRPERPRLRDLACRSRYVRDGGVDRAREARRLEEGERAQAPREAAVPDHP